MGCMRTALLINALAVVQGAQHAVSQEMTSAHLVPFGHIFLMTLEVVLVGVSNAETQPTLEGLPAAESAIPKVDRSYVLLAVLATRWLMASVSPTARIQLTAQRAHAL